MVFSFAVTINLLVVFSVIAMVVGAVAALFGGVVAAADAKGRGGAFFPLIPIGGVIFLCGLCYCLYRLGAVFGFWG